MDNVNHPSHYNKGAIEVIEFIEDRNFSFNVGNAIKYICRAPYKGKYTEDLQKAIFYLKREIDRRKMHELQITSIYIGDFIAHLPIKLQLAIVAIDGADCFTNKRYELAISALEQYIDELEKGH